MHYKLSTWYNNLSNALSSAQNEIRQAGWIKKCEFHGWPFPFEMRRNWHADSLWRRHYSTDFAKIHKMRDFWSMKGKSFISRPTMAITMNTAFLSFFSEWNVLRIEFLWILLDRDGRKSFESNKHPYSITRFIHGEGRSLN